MIWERFKGFKRFVEKNKYYLNKRIEPHFSNLAHTKSKTFCCCFYCLGLLYWGKEIEYIKKYGKYPFQEVKHLGEMQEET